MGQNGPVKWVATQQLTSFWRNLSIYAGEAGLSYESGSIVHKSENILIFWQFNPGRHTAIMWFNATSPGATMHSTTTTTTTTFHCMQFRVTYWLFVWWHKKAGISYAQLLPEEGRLVTQQLISSYWDYLICFYHKTVLLVGLGVSQWFNSRINSTVQHYTINMLGQSRHSNQLTWALGQ